MLCYTAIVRRQNGILGLYMVLTCIQCFIAYYVTLGCIYAESRGCHSGTLGEKMMDTYPNLLSILNFPSKKISPRVPSWHPLNPVFMHIEEPYYVIKHCIYGKTMFCALPPDYINDLLARLKPQTLR